MPLITCARQFELLGLISSLRSLVGEETSRFEGQLLAALAGQAGLMCKFKRLLASSYLNGRVTPCHARVDRNMIT